MFQSSLSIGIKLEEDFMRQKEKIQEGVEWGY